MAIKISGTTVIDDNRKLANHRFTTSIETTSANAVSGTRHYLNGASITLTLPASPTVGDQIGISEIGGNVDGVIGRNSSNIMGTAEDLTIDKAYAAFILTYVDATQGWVFT